MTASLTARFFDGRSARGQPVQLRVVNDALHIQGPDVSRQVLLARVQWPERMHHGVRLIELPDGASLQCDDAQAWDDWRRDMGHRESLVVRAQQSWRAVMACVAALVVAAVVFQQWGIPLAARTVAATAPRSVDDALGAASLAFVDDAWMRPSTLPPGEQQRIHQAFARALAAGQASAPRWQLLFRDSRIGPNALALPGGALILTDQLVRLVDGDADVLTAVLAHELGHVRHRHGLRMVVQVSLLGALSALVLGDFSTLLAGAPVLLGQAGYSRAAEREADAESVRILRAAGISPAVMLTLFERLAHERARKSAETGGRDDWLGLAFATHPADAERIEFFRTAGGLR